jgi:hypothetical protein
MTRSEADMIQKPADLPEEDRFTSLQPTYEDSVPPDPDAVWYDE